MVHTRVADGVHRIEDAYTNFSVVDDRGGRTVLCGWIVRVE